MPARRGGARGAAAVETALCICFIVLPLTFGIISYAYMLSFRQSISQATTEGARAAAVAPPARDAAQSAQNRAAVQDAINNALTNGVMCDLASTQLGRDTDGDGAPDFGVGDCTLTGDGSTERVTIDYDYKAHPLLPDFGLGIVLPDHLSYSASAEVSQ